MFKKLFMLLKIGRKLSTSGAISSIYEIYNPPITIKILFFIIGLSFKDKKNNNNLSPGIKLCNALQGMGTTFIKLGQFLATRPDIIGKDIAKELEKLQDKLPPFSINEAKNILRDEIKKENFDQISNLIRSSNRPLIIFPQGTRLTSEDRTPFKKGASRIYDELKIKCQPVAINSGNVWPKRGKLKSHKNLTISILKPIESGLNKDIFLQNLQDNIYFELDSLN